MDRYEQGKIAKSLAGHDRGKIYVIICQNEAYVYLADGERRTLEKLKRKKKKHVQLINRSNDIESADDVKIKRILKEYKNKVSGMKEDKQYG